MTSIPYENATSGGRARDEVRKILRQFGAERVGFEDHFDTHTLVLGFAYRGRFIQLRASAEGWAAAYLKAHPWSNRKRCSAAEYEQGALEKGLIASNSILRDWIKGQMTAVDTGLMQFEHVFMPYMLTDDGRTVSERVDDLQVPLLEEGRKP